MRIKMIVTDLDCTLLRSDLTVSEYTKDILRRCRAAGIKTAIATGRGNPEQIVPRELFDGIIANNGANITDGDVELLRCIPCDEARPLLLACCERGFQLASQVGGMHYTNFDAQLNRWWYSVRYKMVDFERHELDAEKICMQVKTDDDAAFLESLLTENMYMTIARDGLAMIMNREATKSAAVEELARRWGIKREEIAAFGDDLNDIDMLKFSGVAVVVRNAVDEAKAVAGYVCGSNNDDGVAKWIEENVL